MKLKTISQLIFIMLLGLVCNVEGADIPGSKDNPYVKRFNGSSIVRYKAANYDTLNFYGKDLGKPLSFEGKIVRVAYDVPSGQASSLEVYRNYEQELKAKGFQLANSISVNGSFLQEVSTQRGLPGGLNWAASQNDYYIYATKASPAGTIHIGIAVAELTGDQPTGVTNLNFKKGDIAIYVDSVQEKPLTNKMVGSTAEDMAREIASTGSVNLYGIYFDFNRADIKPESKPTLDEVGKLLTNDPSLKLKVVGHTDKVGTAQYNKELSMRRAQAVVSTLTRDYKVASNRLLALGAGFSQPVASNDTEEGRAKNRRVELIKI